MTAESRTVNRPLHPLGEMTDYELAGYQRNLERALPGRPEAERTVLQGRLADVLREQDERQRIRHDG